MTLEPALVAAAAGKELEVRAPGGEWKPSLLGREVGDEEPLAYFADLVNRGLRWRLKPQPAPALTRVQEMAAGSCLPGNPHRDDLAKWLGHCLREFVADVRTEWAESGGVYGDDMHEVLDRWLGPKGVR